MQWTTSAPSALARVSKRPARRLSHKGDGHRLERTPWHANDSVRQELVGFPLNDEIAKG